MSEQTQTEAATEAPEAVAGDLAAVAEGPAAVAEDPAEQSFAGVASFADAESREILNLLGDTAEGGSCCGGSCCG